MPTLQRGLSLASLLSPLLNFKLRHYRSVLLHRSVPHKVVDGAGDYPLAVNRCGGPHPAPIVPRPYPARRRKL